MMEELVMDEKANGILEKNEGTLQGTIIGMNITSKIASIKLVIEGERGNKNFPSVICFKPNMLAGISIRQRVKITGHTQNRRNVKGNGKIGNTTIFVADEITPSKRRLLDFIKPEYIEDDEGGNSLDENYIYVIGRVISSYSPTNSNGDVCILRLESKTYDNNNYTRQCDFTCFGKQAKIAEMLEPGTLVAMVGYICTSKKEKDGELVYYQNVVNKDLAVLK